MRQPNECRPGPLGPGAFQPPPAFAPMTRATECQPTQRGFGRATGCGKRTRTWHSGTSSHPCFATSSNGVTAVSNSWTCRTSTCGSRRLSASPKRAQPRTRGDNRDGRGGSRARIDYRPSLASDAGALVAHSDRREAPSARRAGCAVRSRLVCNRQRRRPAERRDRGDHRCARKRCVTVRSQSAVERVSTIR
jgi:hypothetical protein